MGDMDGGPEAMSRMQIVKAKQKARGVNERMSRVGVCLSGRPNAEICGQREKEFVVYV